MSYVIKLINFTLNCRTNTFGFHVSQRTSYVYFFINDVSKYMYSILYSVQCTDRCFCRPLLKCVFSIFFPPYWHMGKRKLCHLQWDTPSNKFSRLPIHLFFFSASSHCSQIIMIYLSKLILYLLYTCSILYKWNIETHTHTHEYTHFVPKVLNKMLRNIYMFSTSVFSILSLGSCPDGPPSFSLSLSLSILDLESTSAWTFPRQHIVSTKGAEGGRGGTGGGREGGVGGGGGVIKLMFYYSRFPIFVTK